MSVSPALKSVCLCAVLTSGHAFLRGYFGEGSEPGAPCPGRAAFNARVLSCSRCGKPAATKKCSRCGCARYCGKECQAAAWPSHKGGCVASGAPPPAPPSLPVCGEGVPPALASPVPFEAGADAVMRPWSVSEAHKVWGARAHTHTLIHTHTAHTPLCTFTHIHAHTHTRAHTLTRTHTNTHPHVALPPWGVEPSSLLCAHTHTLSHTLTCAGPCGWLRERRGCDGAG